MTQIPTPLTFSPQLIEKPWGNPDSKDSRTHQKTIGERWLVSTVNETIPSVCTHNGWSRQRYPKIAEKSLHSLCRDHVDWFQSTAFETFPFALKELWLGRSHLSVQVHPSARTVGAGKDECWYIVNASPEAKLYLGVHDGVEMSDLLRVAGTEKVMDLLHVEKPMAGALYVLPAGLLHSAEGPMTIVEIHGAEDTTYRLYDPRPNQRELHIDEALQHIKLASTSRSRQLYAVERTDSCLRQWVKSPSWAVQQLQVEDGTNYHLSEFEGVTTCWYITSGQACLLADGAYQTFGVGDCVVLPRKVKPRGWYGCRDAFSAIIASC